MGRGRAKAKQVKVARQLKYQQPEMDLESLQRELSGGNNSYSEDDDYSDYADKYADWIEDDEDEDDSHR